MADDDHVPSGRLKRLSRLAYLTARTTGDLTGQARALTCVGTVHRLIGNYQAATVALNEALQNLLLRAETPGLRSFIRSVLQGETLGVSIGQILRNVAVEMRKRRRALAEERSYRGRPRNPWSASGRLRVH